MNRYRHLLNQLALIVQQSRMRQADATLYQQRRQMAMVSGALRNHMRKRLIKKAKIVKSVRFAQLKLKERAMQEWTCQVATMKRIRGDQLLW